MFNSRYISSLCLLVILCFDASAQDASLQSCRSFDIKLLKIERELKSTGVDIMHKRARNYTDEKLVKQYSLTYHISFDTSEYAQNQAFIDFSTKMLVQGWEIDQTEHKKSIESGEIHVEPKKKDHDSGFKVFYKTTCS